MNAKEYELNYSRLIGMIEAHMDNDENVVITEKLLDEILSYHEAKSKEEVSDDIREYIGKAVYDKYGQMIFREDKRDVQKQFLDVRGWGAILYMFKSTKDAEAFQDKVGQWVTDVINAAFGKEGEG